VGDLKNYTPAGLPVRILFKDLGYSGRVRKIAAAFDNPSYLIDLDEPVSFEDHVAKLGLGENQKAALHKQIVSDGCLDGDFILCLWMPWEAIELVPREGLFTEYMEPDCELTDTCKGQIRKMKTWPAKITETEPGLAVLQLLDPIPVEAAPAGVHQDQVIGDFVDPESNLLVLLPIDLSKVDATHGLRLMRPETADYYAQFDL
jgi:hypothetical protein